MTWTVKLSNIHIGTKKADVSFVRVEADGTTESWKFPQALLETAQDRVDLLDMVWQKHLDSVEKKDAVDNFISNLEQQAVANLEDRENA